MTHNDTMIDRLDAWSDELEFSPDQLAIRDQVAAQLRAAQDTTAAVAAHGYNSVTRKPDDKVEPKRKHRPKGAGTFYFNSQKNRWIGRIQIAGKRTEVWGGSRDEVESKLSLALSKDREEQVHTVALDLNRQREINRPPALQPYHIEVQQMLTIEADSIDHAIALTRAMPYITEILSVTKGIK